MPGLAIGLGFGRRLAVKLGWLSPRGWNDALTWNDNATWSDAA